VEWIWGLKKEKKKVRENLVGFELWFSCPSMHYFFFSFTHISKIPRKNPISLSLSLRPKTHPHFSPQISLFSLSLSHSVSQISNCIAFASSTHSLATLLRGRIREVVGRRAKRTESGISDIRCLMWDEEDDPLPSSSLTSHCLVSWHSCVPLCC